eukprot:350080-Chlamydomonas_euryale.AAC.4
MAGRRYGGLCFRRCRMTAKAGATPDPSCFPLLLLCQCLVFELPSGDSTAAANAAIVNRSRAYAAPMCGSQRAVA